MPRVERKDSKQLTITQMRVLEVAIDELGYVFDHTKSNMRILAAAVGWKHSKSIEEMLWILREKGVMRSEGASKRRPDRWIIADRYAK